MSSVYITCIIAGPLALGLAPLTLPALSSLSSILDKTFWPKIKRYGDSGSPCLSPLVCLKWSDLPPLTKTSKDIDETHIRIQLVKTKLNPRLVSIAWMNFQLHLS